MSTTPSTPKDFTGLDYGTIRTTAKLEVIQVVIDPTVMIQDYAEGYARDLYGMNPTRYDSLGITADELYDYFKTLLEIRVVAVSSKVDHWREIRHLSIPVWIQFVLWQVGIYEDHDKGLRIVPTLGKKSLKFDISKLQEMSKKLEFFDRDGLTLAYGGFPIGPKGNEEVMSMVILNDYVNSQKENSHPYASYVAAFVGQKLLEEQAFAVLYRIRYDEINFIRYQLCNDVRLL
jgi:hypothetical protein